MCFFLFGLLSLVDSNAIKWTTFGVPGHLAPTCAILILPLKPFAAVARSVACLVLCQSHPDRAQKGCRRPLTWDAQLRTLSEGWQGSGMFPSTHTFPNKSHDFCQVLKTFCEVRWLSQEGMMSTKAWPWPYQKQGLQPLHPTSDSLVLSATTAWDILTPQLDSSMDVL